MTISFPMSNPFTDGEFIDAAALQVIFDAINQIAADLADSGWQTLPLATGFTSVGPTCQYKIIGTIPKFRGKVGPSAGGNFATSTDEVICAVGTFPYYPPNEVDLPLIGSSGSATARGIVGSDGSIHVVTGTVASAYFDLAALSGYDR